ncbi:PglL family O-oligosaccharyltransferase [Acinetobacter higginsii]|uniref:PglL family O-oligosaccharyltransferase n=1 Tax=Acinetobacter higginsii TaxID=70347 RepID=UPI001F4BB969|nr:O-antigen ligase family protein [Acinetobacter higginsii]MCH7338999.1 Wzy polymerase domain-containing protein [Acinetobacter higginsii]MCI3879166.1 Wzy polymerase domain-containing protein [Acinetobacter higginsii]
MQFLCFFLASVLISFAWLSPFHTYPWVTFSGELASFSAGLVLLAVFLNRTITIPRVQLWIASIIAVPLLQWGFGLVDDFSSALLSSLYVFGFWLMIVLGYNLSVQADQRELLMQETSKLLFGIAIVCSVMAIVQWCGLGGVINGVMQLKGDRPYANFGQPNHLATFLIMGLMGALYLYEKRVVASFWLLPTSLLILFTIALTQSRTSWVVCLFILFYWMYKQYKQQPRFNFAQLWIWCIGFFVIAAWGLPLLTNVIETFSNSEVIQTTSLAERASSGYLRFDIWTQMLLALKEQPWLGYGWNQTSIAQISIFNLHPSHEWVISAHNVLLDILVWNGLPLGLLIIGYMAVWFFWLDRNAKDTTSVIAIMMVAAILIHAMLEFPQRYAYFLLPMGFLLGLVQAQTPQLKAVTLNKNVIRVIWLIGIVLLLVIWRDYKLFQENSRLIFKKQQPTVEILGSSKILLLTQFQQRLDWINLKPQTQMSNTDLEWMDAFVKNKATPYNLKKYAQVLVYNHKFQEAEQQLFILQQLYGQTLSLPEVIEMNKQAR